ncbi:MAG: TraI/MobA(P) family conjugative relaxase [Acidovorax sp.]|nr:TraI/MobA(P) family conjugative relaxase [Acidovorax sp.]
MIVKHMPMRSQGKSDYDGLVRYITDPQSKEHRLGQVRVTHCASDRVDAAISEVLATQALNTRAKGDRTYHLLVSFRAGEQPSAEVLWRIEERICEALGFAEHQRISAVHHDTDNLHVHLAINKIHPTRLTLHEPFQAYRVLAQVAQELELACQLQVDNHESRRSVARGRAEDMERHSGVQSLLGWIERECLDELRQAQDWASLHQCLAHNGLQLRPRGQGLVFQSPDGTTVKASSLGREFSLARLQDRLGPFVPQPIESSEERGGPGGAFTPHSTSVETPHHKTFSQTTNTTFPGVSSSWSTSPTRQRAYAKQTVPLRIDTKDLHRRYVFEQSRHQSQRKDALTQWRRRRQRLVDAARRSYRVKRAAIGMMTEGRLVKRVLYTQALQTLRTELRQLQQQASQERARLVAQHRQHTWADWLKQQALAGNEASLQALRSRAAAQPLRGNLLQGVHNTTEQPAASDEPSSALRVDTVTKKGTVLHRSHRSAVRDDGQRLQLASHSSTQDIELALRLAQQRFGPVLQVHGSPQFKAQVVHVAARLGAGFTLADPALEHRRQRLKAATAPVLSPSPWHASSITSPLHTPPQGETPHEPSRHPTHRSGPGSQRGGLDRPGLAAAHPGRLDGSVGAPRVSGPHLTPASRAPASRGTGTVAQPYLGRDGRTPPPSHRHRLRTLSQLGVVRFAEGAQVLLPSDVPGHLEQQGSLTDHALRRGVAGTGGMTPSWQAAHRYVQERETRRRSGLDIPEHQLYEGGPPQRQQHCYAGTRVVDGQALALWHLLDAGTGQAQPHLLVMPVSGRQAQQLSRAGLGSLVRVTPAAADGEDFSVQIEQPARASQAARRGRRGAP